MKLNRENLSGGLNISSGRKKCLLVMRNTFMLLLAGTLHVSAFNSLAYSQTTRLSVEVSNMTVGDVLREIEEQSSFYFTYNTSQVNTKRVVSIKLKDRPVGEILDELFAGENIGYTIKDKHIVLFEKEQHSSPVVSQSAKQITGTVVDEANIPVIGANVMVKGTTTGTITDMNGNFTLEVPDGAMLEVSYIGYVTQTVKVTGTKVSVVIKEDTQKLDEVVVVGYSSKSQSQLSSSVSVVSSEELHGVSTESVAKMLQGKSSGVVISNSTGQPGSEPKITIRGTGSIGAGTSPLYVVDGIIGGTANPNDIESISILKDAAATGLYGSRAANGVIIITTKSGKSGKTRVSFDSSVGFGWKPKSNLDMMNSKEFYEVNKIMYTDKYHTLYGNSSSTISLEDYLNDNIPVSLMNTDTDWQDLTYNTALSQNHSVSISGGGEKTQFYGSFNYYQEDGIFLNTGYEQFNFRTNVKHDITSNLSLFLKVNGRYSDKENNPNADALWDSYVSLPWDNPYNEDGTLKKGTEEEWRGRHKRNLLYPLQWNYDKLKTKQYTTDAKLEYKVTDWIKLSSTNRVETTSSIGEIYYDKRTVEGANSKGELTNKSTDEITLLTSNLITLSKQWNDHNFSGIAGYEYQKTTYSDISATGMGIEPGFEILDVTAEAKEVSGNKTESIFRSYFFQVDYSYLNRYFLVASYRRDASSRFGSENRNGNFYSIGGSYLISNEPFLQDKDNLNLLKLRLSYGTTGNAEIDDFLTYGIYNYDNQYAGNIASYPSQMPNPYLTWEVAHTFNLGVDVGLLSRVNLELDAYQRTNKNLLQDVPLSSSSGFKMQKRNVGAVRNRGVDLNIHTDNLVGNFVWSSDLNFSLNRNKVLELSDGNPIVSGNKSIAEGRELGYFYMRDWAGVDPQTGDPLWIRWVDDKGNTINENDGIKPAKIEKTSVYNDASLLYTKKINPRFTIGFRNFLSYKGFELDFLFNIVSGANIYNSAREIIDSDGTQATQNLMNLKDGWSRWEKVGDIATHPKLILDNNKNANKPSSRYIEDASYIRLQNVTFSYTFPDKWISKLYLSRLRVFVSGDNLWLLTGYSGQDPEFNFENGTDGYKYPTPRKVMFGLNVEF